MLFLANIPDQVQFLTIDGALQMGFTNAQGQEVTFQTTAPASTSPAASLVGPLAGGSTSATARSTARATSTSPSPSNPYTSSDSNYASFSGTLNASSVNSTSPAIQIDDPTSSPVALDTTQVPLPISAYIYRYWLTGVQQSDETGITAADVQFVQGRVSYTDASGNLIFNEYGIDPANPTVTADDVSPVIPTAISLVHAAAIDVRVYPSVGAQLGTSNLLALIKKGSAALQINYSPGSNPPPPTVPNLTPTAVMLLGDGMTVRYLLPADQSYPAGQYTVAIVPNEWGDSLSNAPDNLASSYTFTAVNVNAEVVGPFVIPTTTNPHPSTDVGALNQATFTVPTGYARRGFDASLHRRQLPAGPGRPDQ